MKSKDVRRFALGTILAAGAGYIAGLLTAPKSGKETRQDIKEAASRTIAEAERRLKALHTELSELLNQARGKAETLKGRAQEEFSKAVDVASVAKEKARELLSAAHEGRADDSDLNKAIEELNKASENLKKYLKKQ